MLALPQRQPGRQAGSRIRAARFPRLESLRERDINSSSLPPPCPRPPVLPPQVPDTMLGGVDGAVLDRLAKVMAYMALAGGGRKRLRKKERAGLLTPAAAGGVQMSGALRPAAAGSDAGPSDPQQQQGAAAAAPAPAPESDDDIFGDAGTDYVPVRRKEPAAAPEAAVAAAGDEAGPRLARVYFEGGADTLADLPPLPTGEGSCAGDSAAGAALPARCCLGSLGACCCAALAGEEEGPAMGPARPPGDLDASAYYSYGYPSADDVVDGGAAAAAPPLPEEAEEEDALEKQRAAALRRKALQAAAAGGDDGAPLPAPRLLPLRPARPPTLKPAPGLTRSRSELLSCLTWRAPTAPPLV